MRKLRDEEKTHLEHSAKEYAELGQKSSVEIKGEYGKKFRTE